jgi:AraC-like DNA-binding protein
MSEIDTPKASSVIKYHPAAPLGDFVELFWHSDRSHSLCPPTREAILPDGCGHLVINLTHDSVHLLEHLDNNTVTTLSGSVFCGPRSSPYAILPAGKAVIGVLFRPGGAFAFLSMPTEEIKNAQFPLDSIFGPRGAELRHRLLRLRTVSEKFALLQTFLLSHLRRPLALHRAVGYAIRAFERVPSQTISNVLAEVGLSERRFSRVFSEQVGLTPKLFHRVRRFQKAIASFPSNAQISWARAAVDAGYYDQAHLIHESRTFSSITPGAFLASRIVQRSHLPLPA